MKIEHIVQSVITAFFINVVFDIIFSLLLNILGPFHELIESIYNAYKNHNIMIRSILFSLTVVISYLLYSLKKSDNTVKEIKQVKFGN